MSLREHVQSKYDPNVSGRSWIIDKWDKIAEERGIDKQLWIKNLRELGIKAAHPDDGWVDREENSVYFAYPYFNDKPKKGDLIVLGWPDNKNRIVRVIESKRTGVFLQGKRYFFEELSRAGKV